MVGHDHNDDDDDDDDDHDHLDHHDHNYDECVFKVREGVPKEIEQQICDNIKWIRLSFPWFNVSWLFGCLPI